MVTFPAPTTTTTAAAMDPWGSGDDGEVGETVHDSLYFGFDDDFSPPIDNSVSNKKSEETFSVNDASTKLSTIDFLPRIHESCSSSPVPVAAPSFPPLPKDPLTQMMTSEEYISRLEAKLRKIKGGEILKRKSEERRGLSSSAKQMIDALSTVKESHTHHLMNARSDLIQIDLSSESGRIDINPNFFVQRGFPERIPLTQEELEWLVNHDHLEREILK